MAPVRQQFSLIRTTNSIAIKKNDLNKTLFGADFQWGVSTAAPQIEGSVDAHGRGLSVWDVFSKKKGKIHNNDHPEIATDFYNRYRDDILLVKELNIPNFRFSIAWPRVMPDGTSSSINQPGIDFYNKVIDFCLACGIEPWVTLYHWDLPHALELKGGWTNREIVSWFADYVALCADKFGDRVKHWMVMNEPSVFVGAGYFLGVHAPGRTGLKNFLPAVHHTVLSIAAGGRVLRELCPEAEIGTTFSCSHIEPYSQKPKDIAAAKRVDAILNRLFLEPILGLGYPNNIKKFRQLNRYMLPGDEQLISFDFDFIGLQNYTREIVRHSFFIPYVGARLVKAEKRNVLITTMKWEVHPPAIYNMIRQFDAYSQIRKIIITENGAAFPDVIKDGEVYDPQRLEYLQEHIAQVLKAKNEGAKVGGYFVWTLTDNFEWAEGFHPRFGIIHVDFETQKRTIKASGKWYGAFLK